MGYSSRVLAADNADEDDLEDTHGDISQNIRMAEDMDNLRASTPTRGLINENNMRSQRKSTEMEHRHIQPNNN